MIIFLGTGCPSVDPALLQRRAELQSEKERLELKHKIIKEKIIISETENKVYQNECAKKARYLSNIRERNRLFWKRHHKMMARTEILNKENRKIHDVLFCFGTPYPIALYSSDKALEKTYMQNTKNETLTLEPYAILNRLPLCDDCEYSVIADKALEPMPDDFLITGIELLFDDQKSHGGKVSYAPANTAKNNVSSPKDTADNPTFSINKNTTLKNLGLVILDKNNRIVDELDLEVFDNKLEVYDTPAQNQWTIRRIFFDKKYGPVPIKKGQRWGLKVPKGTNIPCSFIGLTSLVDADQNLIGGIIQIAAYNQNNPVLSFKEINPNDYKKEQRYSDETKPSPDNNANISKIRKTLHPNIRFAIYGKYDN